MRVGLNLLAAVPDIGGGWNYTDGLLRALDAHDTGDEYVAFVTSASDPLVPRSPRFRRVRFPIDAACRPLRVVCENAVIGSFSSRERVDCMHHLFGALPLANRTRSVVTVHDLMVFERPGDFPWLRRRYLRAARRRAATRATLLAPMSKFSADHLERQFGVEPSRMEVVLPSVDFARAPAQEISAFRQQYGLPGAFWLYVASGYLHKNHDRLFEAFRRLRQERDGWPLVLRGEFASPLFRTLAADRGAGTIILLPRLTTAEMPLLYSAASALVFPSLFEGGGLPIIEAMACGCPVIASDIETTREFAGGASVRFDPYDVDSITAAMRDGERSEDLRRRLAEAGMRSAKYFRPARIAAACRRLYERAVERPGP